MRISWLCLLPITQTKITRKLDRGSLTSGYQFSYMLPPRGGHDDCTQDHWDMLIVCIWSKLPNSCAPSPPPVPSSFPCTKLTHPLIPAGKPSLFLPTANSTSELPKLCGSFECFSTARECFVLVHIRNSKFMPIFLEHTFSTGISTVSLMASDPCRMVPVMTVPWPRIEKQWSTAIRRSPPGSLFGRYVCFFKS